jgi:ribose 5-phosphate isomerase B
MKIAIAADHAGFRLKQALRDKLVSEGHQVLDLGTHSADSVDYPDFAAAVASKVASSECERGILVCSSGVGMSIAANKVHGIRAALGVSADEVRLTRAHNDANVLALGATFTDEATAMSLVETFLDTGFDGGRHERRLRKIEQIENQQK